MKSDPASDHAWEAADEACAWVDDALSGWEDVQARVILRRLRDHVDNRIAEMDTPKACQECGGPVARGSFGKDGLCSDACRATHDAYFRDLRVRER